MKYINGKYVPMTAEDIRERQKDKILERSRPLTAEEVTAMLLTQQANTLVVDDNTALRMMDFYPEWTEGIAYVVGFKVRWGDGLWRCRQAHTAQAGWEPDVATSLWERICESHAGTEDDPIPYDAGMALDEGKYYHQDYVIYRCTRNTVDPVYHRLSELVGHYVELI